MEENTTTKLNKSDQEIKHLRTQSDGMQVYLRAMGEHKLRLEVVESLYSKLDQIFDNTVNIGDVTNSVMKKHF
jgi:hypothetical protein